MSSTRAQSDLHWLVYKAGALARLGHNHTIAAGDLTGNVAVDKGDLGASRFELEFSVANLVVDDPMLRSTLRAPISPACRRPTTSPAHAATC